MSVAITYWDGETLIDAVKAEYWDGVELHPIDITFEDEG